MIDRRFNMPGLANGAVFPALTLPAVGGGKIDLPRDFRGSWATVIVYRGHWCPYCNAQLSAFQRALPSLTDAGVRVVALSVDTEAEASATVAKHGLTYPVAHSADPQVTSGALHTYLHDDPAFLESSGFVLDPEGRVVVAAYSSNAIGRLVPEDVLGFVRYMTSGTH
jgi:peroxiredoxin